MCALALIGLFGVGCCQGTSDPVPNIDLPQGKADGLDPIDPADCPGGAPRLVDGRPAAWTIMVYQAGDNNLEDDLDGDFQEMELGVNGTKQVNVLVQQDREAQDGVWRYEVLPDSDLQAVGSKLVGHSDSEPDTGNWQTLADFGQWAAVCYPAEYYVLVVSGHGTGWSQPDAEDGDADSIPEFTDPADIEDTDDATADGDGGADGEAADGETADGEQVSDDRLATEAEGEPYRAIAFDDHTESSLDIEELVTALEFIAEATRRDYDPEYLNRLVIYGSDACLMQTVEVISALGDPVTYVIGSEKTEPAAGWPYSTILRELTARPLAYARAPQDLAAMIVEKYGISYGPHGGQGDKKDLTLSAVNLDHARRLRNDIEKITGLLQELRAESALGEELDDYIWAARRMSPLFSDTYVDLAEFLMNLRANLIADGLMPRIYQHWDGDERWRTLRNAMDEAVDEVLAMTRANIEDAAPTADGKADGVSIYFPDWKYSYVLSLENYLESPFSQKTGWGSLLETLLETRYPY
jgi:hypothetical protein